VQRRRRRRRVSPVRSGTRLSFGAGPAQANAVATGSDKTEKERKQKKTHGSACGKPGKKSNFYSLGDPAEQTVRHGTQCVHVGRSHHPTNGTSYKHQNLVARARTSCAHHSSDPFTVVPTIYSRRRCEPSYDDILILRTVYVYTVLYNIQYRVYSQYTDKNQNNIISYDTFFWIIILKL